MSWLSCELASSTCVLKLSILFLTSLSILYRVLWFPVSLSFFRIAGQGWARTILLWLHLQPGSNAQLHLWVSTPNPSRRHGRQKLVAKAAPDFELSWRMEAKEAFGILAKESKLSVIDFYANFWPACGPAASEMDKLANDHEILHLSWSIWRVLPMEKPTSQQRTIKSKAYPCGWPTA